MKNRMEIIMKKRIEIIKIPIKEIIKNLLMKGMEIIMKK